MAGDDMENNGKVSLNWVTFNVPTILAIATVGWYLATKQERQDARLDAIEISRVQRSTEINKMLEALALKVGVMDNLIYRVTVSENGITNVNTRVDRVGESVSQRLDRLQESLVELGTKFEVLDQRITSAFPAKSGVRFDRGGNIR